MPLWCTHFQKSPYPPSLPRFAPPPPPLKNYGYATDFKSNSDIDLLWEIANINLLQPIKQFSKFTIFKNYLNFGIHSFLQTSHKHFQLYHTFLWHTTKKTIMSDGTTCRTPLGTPYKRHLASSLDHHPPRLPLQIKSARTTQHYPPSTVPNCLSWESTQACWGCVHTS